MNDIEFAELNDEEINLITFFRQEKVEIIMKRGQNRDKKYMNFNLIIPDALRRDCIASGIGVDGNYFLDYTRYEKEK